MEPTIYKPSIYKGAGIYKAGAEGGGGGGIPDNIKLFDAVLFNNGWICNELDGKYEYKINYRYVYSGYIKVTYGSGWQEAAARVYAPGWVAQGAKVQVYINTSGNVTFSLSNFTNTITKGPCNISPDDTAYFPILVENKGLTCLFNGETINYSGSQTDVGASYIDFAGNPTKAPVMNFFKIYDENENLIHEFRPAVNLDTGDNGIYDKVKNEFWINARGQTPFIDA